MSEFITPDVAPDELLARAGLPVPNPRPYDGITPALVVWNEEERIGALLDYLKEHFLQIAVVVQASDDRTLEIVTEKLTRPRDRLATDVHHGFGDASLPMLIGLVQTEWIFTLAADEWPSDDLIGSLWSAIRNAERDPRTADGLWIPFHSDVNGVPYEEQHGHLRVFRKAVGHPGTLHSRPSTNRALWWPIGHITHHRTLDEMMRDYLRYWELGAHNGGWVAHNRLMMHDACVGVASARGWAFVQSHDWWPEVEAIAFTEEKPWQSTTSASSKGSARTEGTSGSARRVSAKRKPRKKS